MNTTPNGVFEGTLPPDPDFEHPPGCYLARKLRIALEPTASCVSDFRNWHDLAWRLVCEWEGISFEIFLLRRANPGPATWIIAIAPMLSQPGFLCRLFGAKSVPCVAQCRALTNEIHKILKHDPLISNIRWALNADAFKSAVTDPNDLNWERTPRRKSVYEAAQDRIPFLGPIRHPVLQPELIERIRRLEKVFVEVYPITHEEWLDGFQRDSDPDNGVSTWEVMALAYTEFLETNDLDAAARHEAFVLLLNRSERTIVESDLLNLKHLTADQGKNLVALYTLPPQPLIIEYTE